MKKFLFISFFTALFLMPMTFLMVSGLGKEKINILIYGTDGRGSDELERSDAIILANIDLNNGDIVVTSIPRDSYVKITCYDNKYNKINHAYAYGGGKCLKDTVSQLFNINNIYNMSFQFDDIVEIIDYFGLISLTPNYTFCQSDEKFQNTYCFEKNKKILIDGQQALAYMRNRKSLPRGDLDRVKNQRQIIKILINEFLKLGLIEKLKFYKFAKKVVKTDMDLTDFNLKKMISVKHFEISEYTLKGEDYIDKYYYYKLDPIYLEKIKKCYI